MTENKRLEFREIEHEWGTTHYFTYNGNRIQESEVAEMFNEMFNENQQLVKEKEDWKSSACNNSSFNSILLHELDIAQEQGYKLSDPFKKLMGEKND